MPPASRLHHPGIPGVGLQGWRALCSSEVRLAPWLAWFSEPWGSAWRACNFFLLRQEKVTKKKATPGSTPGFARFLALLGLPGGSLNSPPAGTRTTRPEGPRKPCVAQRLPWGERRPGFGAGSAALADPARTMGLKGYGRSARPLLGPLRGAEPRRGLGGSRLALSEPPWGASLASRPSPRVAQGSPRRGPPTQGWLLLWLLSSCHQEESTPAPPARNPWVQKSDSTEELR